MLEWLFKQYWRINQARNLISIFFWIAMIVGIWVPLIQIVVPLNKWMLIPIVTVACLVGAFIIGYVWDKLGLWREESKQNADKTYHSMHPLEKEKKYLIPLQLETARAVAKMTKNKSLQKRIDEVKHWLDY